MLLGHRNELYFLCVTKAVLGGLVSILALTPAAAALTPLMASAHLFPPEFAVGFGIHRYSFEDVNKLA